MPWFITSVCSDETLERRAKDRGVRPCYISRSRCFGFYDTHAEAYKAVMENRGGLQECLYEYVTLEYMEPGVHPTVHAQEWFRWNVAENKWEYLSQDDWPFTNVCNWALG